MLLPLLLLAMSLESDKAGLAASMRGETKTGPVGGREGRRRRRA